jgi:hypothetical protein
LPPTNRSVTTGSPGSTGRNPRRRSTTLSGAATPSLGRTPFFRGRRSAFSMPGLRTFPVRTPNPERSWRPMKVDLRWPLAAGRSASERSGQTRANRRPPPSPQRRGSSPAITLQQPDTEKRRPGEDTHTESIPSDSPLGRGKPGFGDADGSARGGGIIKQPSSKEVRSWRQRRRRT